MANSQPTLVELAAKVTELSETFTKYLKENNVPAPTFAADSPTSYKDLGPEVFTLRQTLIDTLQDMWILTQGPSESVFNYVHSVRVPLQCRRLAFVSKLTPTGHTRCCSSQHSEPLRLLGCRTSGWIGVISRNRETCKPSA